MANRTKLLTLSLVAVAAVTSAWAIPSLKSTMKSWKADAGTLDRMLGGSFDATEATRILNGFVTDSQFIGARLAGAQARDVKSRFDKFGGDAQAMIDAIASKDHMKARFSQLVSDCRSCHDVYAN